MTTYADLLAAKEHFKGAVDGPERTALELVDSAIRSRIDPALLDELRLRLDANWHSPYKAEICWPPDGGCQELLVTISNERLSDEWLRMRRLLCEFERAHMDDDRCVSVMMSRGEVR